MDWILTGLILDLIKKKQAGLKAEKNGIAAKRRTMKNITNLLKSLNQKRRLTIATLRTIYIMPLLTG
jgi:hypothetical protein